MAIVCPVDLDTGRLRHEIQAIYARVATDPSSEFHFHRGPAYAAERLGYDASALGALPSLATDSFAGVANPLRIATLPAGATVVESPLQVVDSKRRDAGAVDQARLESEAGHQHQAIPKHSNAYAISDLAFQNSHLVCVRKPRCSSGF